MSTNSELIAEQLMGALEAKRVWGGIIYNVILFGADPTGKTDSTDAIQKAINMAANSGGGIVYVPIGNYIISLDGGTYSGKGTGLGLSLRDNVWIDGPGTLKLISGSSGSFAMMANTNDSITNCVIRNITIDGNRDAVSGNTSGIILFGASGCLFENVNCINSSYVGLMMRGGGGERNRITGCIVDNIANIGIQCQYNEGLVISDNQVYNTGDNAYDIEGNSTTDSLGLGKQVIINANIANGCLNGIFLESVGQIIVSGNSIYNVSQYGIHNNRISSGSQLNKISCNMIRNENTAGAAGIIFNNNVGKTTVYDNTIDNFTDGCKANTGIDHVVFGMNYFRNISKYLVNITPVLNSMLRSQIEKMYYEGAQTNGFPKTTSPVTESSNHSDRVLNVTITPAVSLETNAVLRDTFYNATTNTASNPAWGGSYSVYTGGETIVYITASQPSAGSYLKINNVFFVVYAVSGPEIKVRNPSNVAGDYTATTNGSYTVYKYTQTEYNAAISD